MTIRVLQGDHEKAIEFTLKKSEGLLLLKFEKGPGKCFHFIDTAEDEYAKISPFLSELVSYKFLGSQSIYQKFKENYLTLTEKEERFISIQDDTKIRYQASSSKISFESQSPSHEKLVRTDKPIKKVMIIDDSKTIQKMISTIVKSSKRLEVHSIAACPSEARTILEQCNKENNLPDLITLDIHMPEMTGVEFLKTYLKDFDIPVIMISSISIEEGSLVLDALANGAQTYIQKPTFNDLKQDMAELRGKIEVIAFSDTPKITLKSETTSKNLVFNSFDGVVAIGSSTGGTQALQHLFENLPSEIPPFVVTQHIPEVFSKALADRLNKLCPFEVKEVEDGEFLEKNTIYIAPGGKQFKVNQRGDKIKCEVNDDEPVNRFRPSVDYLFNSIVKCRINTIVGVILTGMGQDGAEGLLHLKEIGAHTIAQDEKSCVVFGMPKVAIELNAHKEIVSLNSMSEKIVEAFNAASTKKLTEAS